MNGHLSAVRKGSQTPFHRALRKYGREGFEMLELAVTPDREYAHFLERLYIATYRTNSNESGYNASQGGEASAFGMTHTAAWKQQHSAQMTGVHHPLFGTHRSVETKARISQAKKGRLVRTDVSTHELCAKYREGLTTRELSAMFHMQRKNIQKRLHAAGVKMRQGGWRVHIERIGQHLHEHLLRPACGEAALRKTEGTAQGQKGQRQTRRATGEGSRVRHARKLEMRTV